MDLDFDGDKRRHNGGGTENGRNGDAGLTASAVSVAAGNVLLQDHFRIGENGAVNVGIAAYKINIF